MFSNPMLKTYNELPPTREDLEEVLAFIFIGRNKVADALEWLKLNHRDYADIIISKENLDSYEHAGVPVTVDFKRTEHSASNKLPTEMSVHDDEDDKGTTDGPCPFSVHGLTGPEYEEMDMQALKIKAAAHLLNDGKTLAVGHAEKPASMYDNPQAYPQMFPWLFPYRFGGFGNELISGRIGEGTHMRNLLLYQDK
ncbi:hypothetical protein B0H10DRAFT_2233230 [Mycena sp. CBHHK59/15]|nr:hypothetical protein B0H10DRAFT_2233230 [Mycena sp. CBHHK59/15]